MGATGFTGKPVAPMGRSYKNGFHFICRRHRHATSRPLHIRRIRRARAAARLPARA